MLCHMISAYLLNCVVELLSYSEQLSVALPGIGGAESAQKVNLAS